jgi:hypothetical protein|tara:strand:+ start:198 stop:431 length:234 start_codon:yes stop_codon:yes gene_type:complete
MINGKDFRQILDKFLVSPAVQHARVQVELPDGYPNKFMDILEISLLENRILGSKETHRLVLKVMEPRHVMGKIIKKL